ncbi:Hypothetical protein FKW44_014651 [Caligus rogercresseyi]|uniref:Uncharacterized protein n=1 Tax=Caligus rogercresseyi TaxID=217165 RepID=A0A7T8GZB0_CALRO|nr:Hypothetical protein FKW44_014651 [Caligus rogercresseyi]
MKNFEAESSAKDGKSLASSQSRSQPLDFHFWAAAQTRVYKEKQIPLSLSYYVSNLR